MLIDPTALARMSDDELAETGDRFLEAIIAEGMTDAAMPALAMLLHQMSLSASMWRPSRPERSRVVSHRADNVLHVDFGSQPTKEPDDGKATQAAAS
jgi:hypothetical protein